MRRFWNHYKAVIIALFIWRLLLALVSWAAPYIITARSSFLSPEPWSNMDGGHYLYIASSGYGLFEQAFFPFYPLLIRGLSFLPVQPAYIGLLISHAAFFIGILLFYDLSQLIDRKNALWSILLLLSFPTSFFFAAVYPTSLYFLLSVATLSAIERRKPLLAGLTGLLSSITRVYGAFLVIPLVYGYMKSGVKMSFQYVVSSILIPAGLFIYMVYLYVNYGDALKFIHVLPAYGLQRGAGQIILLPQVFWRYIKIFTTAAPVTVEYMIAIFEVVVFIFFLYLLVRAFKAALNPSYILYCGIILILPTLTGSLTSIPRYVLDAFPLFIVMGMAHNTRVKIVTVGIMSIGLVICAALFLRGYFVA